MSTATRLRQSQQTRLKNLTAKKAAGLVFTPNEEKEFKRLSALLAKEAKD